MQLQLVGMRDAHKAGAAKAVSYLFLLFSWRLVFLLRTKMSAL